MSELTSGTDRAAQISARLAIGVTSWGDVRWLLAERAELLARVEAVERAGAVKTEALCPHGRTRCACLPNYGADL